MLIEFDKKVYRVTFVHSTAPNSYSYDWRGNVSGSLRQLVDNIARSARRRVTFCEVAAMVPSIDHSPMDLAEVTPDTPRLPHILGQGLSMCHYMDQFRRDEGRAYAFSRALHNSGLTVNVKDGLTEYVMGMSYDELRENYR